MLHLSSYKTIIIYNNSFVGFDKICSAKFEQNGQPEERSNSSSKMGCQFAQNKQNEERMSPLPAKLLARYQYFHFQIYLVSHIPRGALMSCLVEEPCY